MKLPATPKKMVAKKPELVLATRDKKIQKKPWPAWAYRLIEVWADSSVNATTLERCKEATVPRATFYRAIQKPDFAAWCYKSIDARIHVSHREVDMALICKCTQGDLEAMKLFYEIYPVKRRPARAWRYSRQCSCPGVRASAS